MIKKILIVFVGASIALSSGAIGVFAQSGLFQFIDQETLEKGYTFSYEGTAFRLVLPPRALRAPSDIRITQEYSKDRGALLARPPDGMLFASNIYSYSFSQDSVITRNVGIVIASSSNNLLSAIYRYDDEKKQWERLPTSPSGTDGFRTMTRAREGTFAVLQYENEDAQLSALMGSAKSLMVADTKYHTFIAQNTSEQMPLASLTKLMTALVFLDARIPWGKKIIINAHDDAQPAKVPFANGDVVTVKDLFMSMLVGSKNNSAKALARSTGLSEKEFIKRMNQKAKNFGMTQTTFVDVTGLDPGNVSPARDIYRLARVALAQRDIKDAVATRSYRVRVLNRKKSFSVYTTDELLDGSKDVYGKTGYIPEVGYNLVVVSQRKKEPIIAVILGAPSNEQRFDLAEAVLRRAW